MLVDANILLYAVDETNRFHSDAKEWLETALNGERPVGIPWQSLWAFLRIATNPRALADPLDGPEAWGIVDAWLAAPAVWVPAPGKRHRELLAQLVVSHDLRGNLIADAVLAALCLEHGTAIVSADSDFARFTELRWINPLGVQPG